MAIPLLYIILLIFHHAVEWEELRVFRRLFNLHHSWMTSKGRGWAGLRVVWLFISRIPWWPLFPAFEAETAVFCKFKSGSTQGRDLHSSSTRFRNVSPTEKHKLASVERLCYQVDVSIFSKNPGRHSTWKLLTKIQIIITRSFSGSVLLGVKVHGPHREYIGSLLEIIFLGGTFFIWLLLSVDFFTGYVFDACCAVHVLSSSNKEVYSFI